MKIKEPHLWNLSVQQARTVQKELASRISYQSLPRNIYRVAGCDVAYLKEKQQLIAGMVVLDYPSLSIIDTVTSIESISFPYIPGFLSFREAPALLNLLKDYPDSIDLFIFDGHGIAHPRNLGIAAHIGVLIDKPTIGCAKKKLVGYFDPPGKERGCVSDLIYNNKIVGRVVRTKDDVKPLFVSIGNAVDLESAVDVVLSCCSRYRLPEPTRLADIEVAKAKRYIN
jgi:deoxyribonuclease V